jgi:hypothetical protein
MAPCLGDRLPGPRSPRSPHCLEHSAPAEQQYSERDGGDHDEARSKTPPGGHPQSHADDDRASQNNDTGSKGRRIPPGPRGHFSDKAADKERPRRGRHPDQVVRFLVTAPANDGEDQHADHIGSNR